MEPHICDKATIMFFPPNKKYDMKEVKTAPQ